MPEPRQARVALRDIYEGDLQHFFDDHRDEEANKMAAFTAKDPHDRAAFDAHWSRNLSDPAIINRTVLVDDAVAGHIAAHQAPDLGGPEVTYWISRAFWGTGVATRALRLLLEGVAERRLYARCAKTHGRDVEEYVLRLDDRDNA